MIKRPSQNLPDGLRK